jgi:hypothetical protein
MTSLYFTEQRAENALSHKLDLSLYQSGTGVMPSDWVDQVHWPSPYGAATVPPAGPFPSRFDTGIPETPGMETLIPHLAVAALVLLVLSAR